MFKKAFKTKSTTQLSGTERKQFKERFLSSFPKLTENTAENIMPKKELITCKKVLTTDGNAVQIYLVQKLAIAFEFENRLFPSVYLLWKYDDLVLTFTTNSFVIQKVRGGADLMLPGVIMNPNGHGAFRQNTLAAINSNQNSARIAVGVTAMSSHEIHLAKGQGKCVVVYHFFGDKLCYAGDTDLQAIPFLGPPDWLRTPSIGSQADFPPLNNNLSIENPQEGPSNVGSQKPENENTMAESEEIETESNRNEAQSLTPNEMDELLCKCFLTALKYSTTAKIPVLVSTFYKLEVLKACPIDKKLDIKKTSYKKFGLFLQHMCKEGLIVVKEQKKGIDMIDSVNKDHPMFVNFYLDAASRPKKPIRDDADEAAGPSIIESYSITKPVEGIFREFGLKKGDSLAMPDIRRHVTNYVKTHNYQDETNKSLVKVGETPLSSICKNKSAVLWEELMDNICAIMTPALKITSGEEQSVFKGKIQPIIMSVQTRSGNKKVTLVDNLEQYSINISEFAKECQVGIGASTSVNRPPGKKCDQLLVQGNQVLFINKLLIEKYKIPKKYIQGLENATKKK